MELENQQYIHRKTLRLKMFLGICLGILCYLIYLSYLESEMKKYTQYSFLSPHIVKLLATNASTPSAEKVSKNSSMESYSPKSTFNPESEIHSESDFKSQKARPEELNVSMSTSPANSMFIIQNRKDSYQIGEELCVTIHARDFNNKSKRYGGDFFQAKLFSSKNPQKASVFGEVMDLSNGSYSVCFLLPWVGQGQVAVRLIHSSEAVEVLKRHRETDSDRVFFNGYFEGPAPDGAMLRETVKCNVKSDKNGLERMGTGDCCCEYKDSRTGEEWRCQRPKILQCSARIYHSMGGYNNLLTEEEAILLTMANQYIYPGEKSIINIAPSNRNITDERKKCRPGLHTPVPSGFYLADVWTSFVCSTHHFTPQITTQCLKDKEIYMMGDSTLRQWFDFLIKTVPTLKQMNLHISKQTGPLLAVDVENNIFLNWRAHGVPIRCQKTEIANLHYISNEIEDLAGGPHTVIAFNLGVHFTTFPSDIFTRRVLRIRKAVLDLLQRAPETTVIIKTVNTGFKDVFASDWYCLELDRILRQAFQDVGVYILDVWQMTSCHYNKDNIHPGPVIIKNEIDIFLSFMCPDYA